MIKITLAGLCIGIEENSPRFAEFIAGYETQDGAPVFTVSTTEEDIAHFVEALKARLKL